MQRWLSFWLCLFMVVTVSVVDGRLNAVAPQAATYYIRSDGGNPTQCTGLTNAAYSGSGTNQACAWDHPFRALPPYGVARIAGGDTLIIGAGSYRMGIGALGAEACADPNASYDCHMISVPSGPSALNPTRILGAGWESGCTDAPELWGTGRPWQVVLLDNSDNVELRCLEITDHSKCIENYTDGSPLKCQRDSAPYGDWAANGLWAQDSDNVSLSHINIHGIAGTGVVAGRLSNWLLEDVQIVGNAFAGWNGELPGQPDTSSNSGTLTFRRLRLEWNGCAEDYPNTAPIGCWSSYGDGLGTAKTGGNWLFEDSSVRYNTSDGLDLLYVREPNSSITVRRSHFEGNAGNQLKTYRGAFHLENSVIIGNCGFFAGKSFNSAVTSCRAQGSALSVGLMTGESLTAINNTIASEGDCLVLGYCSEGNCNGTEKMTFRNTIFQGATDFLQQDVTCLAYQETFPQDPFDIEYSIINTVKNNECPGIYNQCGVAPGVVSANITSFDAHLLASSPAVNAALASVAPASDFNNYMRDLQPDIGAYEYGATPPLKVFVPLIRR